MYSRYSTRLLILQAVGIISIFRRSICLATAALGMAASVSLQAQMVWTNSGLSGQRAFALIVDARGGMLAASDSGVYRSSDDGKTWMAAGLAKRVYSLAINNRGIALALYSMTTGTNDGLARSTDWGTTWTSIPFKGHANGVAMDGNGVPILMQSASLSRSSDDGSTWTELKDDGFTEEFFDFHKIAFGPDNEYMLGNWGISGGLVFGSGDEGESWFPIQDVASDMPVLEYSPAGTLFIASSAQFVRSTDGGGTWGNVAGVEGHPMAMAFRGGDIYLQADGIYRSSDEGVTWSRIGSLPTVPNNPRLAAFTVAANGDLLLSNTDGLHRLSLAASVDNGTERGSTLSIHPNPVRGLVTINLPAAARGACRLQALDLLGHTVATIAERAEPGTQAITWNTDGLAAGVYLIRMELDGAVRTARVVVAR